MTDTRKLLEARIEKLTKIQVEAALNVCEKYGFPTSDEPLCLITEDSVRAGANFLLDDLLKAIECLEFYAAFATKENHQFIFDDENLSRAQIYEKYKKCSIGSLGVKAYETLSEIKQKMGAG
jgi:hypothetical protein